MVTLPDHLPDYDWRTSPALEDPTTSPKTTWEFPVSETHKIIVTNTFMSGQLDRWMVWDVGGEGVEGIGNLHMRFLGGEMLKTDALNKARGYAWLEYGFDISVYDIPF